MCVQLADFAKQYCMIILYDYNAIIMEICGSLHKRVNYMSQHGDFLGMIGEFPRIAMINAGRMQGIL